MPRDSTTRCSWHKYRQRSLGHSLINRHVLFFLYHTSETSQPLQVRFLESSCCLITAFKVSVSAMHLLVPLTLLSIVSTLELECLNPIARDEVGVHYVSRFDRWGRERVGTMKRTRSKRREMQSDELLEHSKRLFTVFCEAEGCMVPP
jgi:3-keto steroid reductase